MPDKVANAAAACSKCLLQRNSPAVVAACTSLVITCTASRELSSTLYSAALHSVCLFTGLIQAVASGVVAAMLPCLTQGSLTLASATVEALMQITIAVQGKQAMVSCLL